MGKEIFCLSVTILLHSITGYWKWIHAAVSVSFKKWLKHEALLNKLVRKS